MKNYYEYEQNQHYMNRNQKNDIEMMGLKNESDENYENYESSNQEIVYQYSQQTKFIPRENDERHLNHQKNNVRSKFCFVFQDLCNLNLI